MGGSLQKTIFPVNTHEVLISHPFRIVQETFQPIKINKIMPRIIILTLLAITATTYARHTYNSNPRLRRRQFVAPADHELSSSIITDRAYINSIMARRDLNRKQKQQKLELLAQYLALRQRKSKPGGSRARRTNGRSSSLSDKVVIGEFSCRAVYAKRIRALQREIEWAEKEGDLDEVEVLESKVEYLLENACVKLLDAKL